MNSRFFMGNSTHTRKQLRCVRLPSSTYDIFIYESLYLNPSLKKLRYIFLTIVQFVIILKYPTNNTQRQSVIQQKEVDIFGRSLLYPRYSCCIKGVEREKIFSGHGKVVKTKKFMKEV
ncbi:MAG: hypothetical protein A2Y97_09470 [Nitrospirae bacterium RBG_13_39_12]|nr:MAG: hypothetical protein A2Y97_09470 [Nitrospirae bacterium RBG_13_39_12]